ncbi:hypothetical protein CWE08_10310 [Aliidiomarina iranensis]|uniref:Teneurin-like YD-shell domain-containing protein n=1 Tax=Aliidiomarina iranensis TaxID=1434071 RepID=A0A432VRN1_9GAMM|nr:hypothetical protein [Aliidiomarina iranensis]RUO18945.1 hypothetical protein CWE08_10310 [Aliidiomarina iranensis]
MVAKATAKDLAPIEFDSWIKPAHTESSTSTEQGKTTTITQHGVAELISEGGETWFRRNLGNAIVELRQGERGESITTRYVYTDHLGSVDVITDDAGQVEEKLSFDAFGKRRAVFKSNNQAVNFTLASILSLTHKGYTGHEQVDHASVVQMGGRIYDAHIGRFLQAAPFVQSPSNSQNFNRYSHVFSALVYCGAQRLPALQHGRLRHQADRQHRQRVK